MGKEFKDLDSDVNIGDIVKAHRRTIKLVSIALENKTVEIPIYYSLSAFTAYQDAVENTGDLRKSFCIMVFKIINNNKSLVNNEEEIMNININDIENLSDKDLEKIMDTIINSSAYLKEYELMLVENHSNIFEKFNSIYELENEKYQAELKKIAEQLKPKFDTINKYASLSASMSIVTKIEGINNIGSSINPDIEYFTNKMGILVEQTMHTDRLIQNSMNNLAFQMTLASNVLGRTTKEFYSKLNSTRKVLLPESIDYLKSMIKIQKPIRQTINDNFSRHLQAFENNLNYVFDFKHLNNTIDFTVFKKDIVNKLEPFILGMQERLFIRTNIRNNIEQKSKTMLEFGWWFIGSISIKIINYIHENKDTLNEQDVNKIIRDYYTLNDFYELDKIINQWEKSMCFRVWMPKVNDALFAHKHGKYSLSIPIWIMMIEGIIRDFMRSVYGVTPFRFNPLYKNFKEKAEELDAFLISHVFYCMDSFYISFDPKKPDETDDFNRHKIFHGQAQGYDMPIHSLKLILYLDEIFYIISSLENNIAMN